MATLFASTAAHAAMTTIDPIQDIYAEVELGVGSTTSEGTDTLLIERDSPSYNELALIEFPLAALPDAAELSKVELRFTVPLMESNSNNGNENFPGLSIYIRPGDGALDSDDLLGAYDLAGSVEVDDLGTFTVAFLPVATSFVQDYIAGGEDYLTVLLTISDEEDDNLTVGIEALEAIGSNHAALVVTYVPEPASLGLVTLLAAVTLRRGRSS